MLPAHLSMHFSLVIKQAAITILFYLRGGEKKKKTGLRFRNHHEGMCVSLLLY